MMKKTTGLLAALMILTGCPDQNNGVAPVEDVGETDTGPTADAGDEDAGEDLGPDIPPEPGSLNIEPTQITFEDVRQGESETATIAVTNVGGEPITVTNIQLQEFNRRGDPEFKKGADWQNSFTVGPGTFQNINIVYEPNDYDLDSGQVTLQTNDPDNEIVEIRITTVTAYADIDGPRNIRFGEVDVGDDLTKEVFITNRGIDPLTIENIELMDLQGVFFITPDPTLPIPAVLETDEDYVLEVRYEPLTADTDRGTVIVTSDDPDEGTYNIGLTGNDPSPCITITPRPVDLGKLRPGEEGSRTVTLLNCSRSLQLEVNNIELTDDGGGAFSIGQIPEVPFTIAPLQTSQFEVTGSLPEPGTAEGELDIDSNDDKTDPTVGLRISADENN